MLWDGDTADDLSKLFGNINVDDNVDCYVDDDCNVGHDYESTKMPEMLFGKITLGPAPVRITGPRSGIFLGYEALLRDDTGLNGVSSQEVMVRGVDISRPDPGKVYSELMALRELGTCHHNVVTLYEFGRVGSVGYFVTDRYNCTIMDCLFTNKPTLSQRQQKSVIRQALTGINYVHAMGYAHNAIHEKNFLLRKIDPWNINGDVHVALSGFSNARALAKWEDGRMTRPVATYSRIGDEYINMCAMLFRIVAGSDHGCKMSIEEAYMDDFPPEVTRRSRRVVRPECVFSVSYFLDLEWQYEYNVGSWDSPPVGKKAVRKEIEKYVSEAEAIEFLLDVFGPVVRSLEQILDHNFLK
jgi:hypothetical protein